MAMQFAWAVLRFLAAARRGNRGTGLQKTAAAGLFAFFALI
jgi:hypothetical protein